MTKLMLVDDDATIRSLIGEFLEYEGYQVIQSAGEGGPQALLALLGREKPALVLIDVHLKQGNGFDLLKHIRGVPEFDNIKVLMSSGMELRLKSVQEGADGFISKPYMPDDLAEAVAGILAHGASP